MVMVNEQLPVEIGCRRAPRMPHGIGLSALASNFMQICGIFASNMDKKRSREPTALSRLSASVRSNTQKNKTNSEAKGGAMMFLLRAAFWLSVIILLLPTGSQRPKAEPQIGTADAISAASATVSDMRQFCSRQPDACAVGSQAVVAFGYKAQAGAKMLYEFLTDKLAPADNSPLTTASVGTKPAHSASQDTLRPADLAVPWRGPLPRPDPRHNRSV